MHKPRNALLDNRSWVRYWMATLLVCGCARSKNSGSDSVLETGLSETASPNSTSSITTSSTTPSITPAANSNTKTSTKHIDTQPVAWPNLGFVNDPGGKDAKAVALTFDDGPDGTAAIQWGKNSPSNMSSMLDQLDKLGLKATFFVCGNLWTDVTKDAQAQADIQRMVSSGHDVGSHTLTHAYLTPNTPRNVAAGKATLTLAQVKAEFDDNVKAFSSDALLGSAAANFTMYRAPYGNPFEDGIVYPPDANSIVDDVTGIAPSTPPNAVHIGWGIDTDDWQCAQNGNDASCVVNNLNKFLDAGASGPILMHTVYSLSVEALPLVVQSIYDHGYHIVMVEDMIKDKYGAYSADIARANAGKTFTTEEINAAAVAAAKESKWYLRTNEG